MDRALLAPGPCLHRALPRLRTAKFCGTGLCQLLERRRLGSLGPHCLRVESAAPAGVDPKSALTRGRAGTHDSKIGKHVLGEAEHSEPLPLCHKHHEANHGTYAGKWSRLASRPALPDCDEGAGLRRRDPRRADAPHFPIQGDGAGFIATALFFSPRARHSGSVAVMQLKAFKARESHWTRVSPCSAAESRAGARATATVGTM